MRANVLDRPEIKALLKNYVLLELYTDGDDAVSQANAKLELEKFGTVEQPFYAIEDPDEKLIDSFRDRTNASTYLGWLRKVPAPTQEAASTVDLPQVTKLDGSPLDTASLSGKVVVVNFWATYCIPCVGELPAFNKVHRDFAAKGVAMIGVSMDEPGTPVQPFLHDHPIDYTVAKGGDAVAKEYNLESYPVTLVFDRTGKQVKRFNESLTEADLLATIQKSL